MNHNSIKKIGYSRLGRLGHEEKAWGVEIYSVFI